MGPSYLCDVWIYSIIVDMIQICLTLIVKQVEGNLVNGDKGVKRFNCQYHGACLSDSQLELTI
jgi:hypothetical protein